MLRLRLTVSFLVPLQPQEMVDDMRRLLSELLFRAGFASCCGVIVQYLY